MRPRWFVYLLIVAPLCWFFGGALWQGRILDFRDIGHYYRPLWQWTSQEWAAGRVPLWCDLDGLGLPAHADPTTSVFYPGQLLFALPLSFTTRLNLYVTLHVLLAAGLMYRTARAFEASRAGAAAAALSYAFGGYVLFQYCNPIFLVGAAWLPLAVLATERTCVLRSWRWAMALAVTVSLMVLGGDLQLAYHVGMLAALQMWLRLKEGASRWSTVCALLCGLLLAGALSAVQLLPTAQWSARSERAMTENPRSLWELHHQGDIIAGTFHEPPSDSHHERIYDFSVGPWRWLEFIWPNIGGRMFPKHQRWMSALPAEGRVWTPSLYLGLLPLTAACAAFSLRRRAAVRTRWLSWITLIGLFGSLGVYGLGWLWQELSGDLFGRGAEKPPVFAAVGGLYWYFVVLLPGYVQFRYPAKLMVLASLGLSLLAARGWDELFTGEKTHGRFWRCVGGLVTVGSITALIVALGFPQVFHNLPAEFPFGPLQVAGAQRDVAFAAIHALALLACAFIARRYGRRFTWIPIAAVAVTALDLSIAHGWMVSSSKPTLAQHLQWPESTAPLRVYRGEAGSFAPEHWNHSASPGRVEEVLAWQELSLGEKCFLTPGVNLVDAQSTLEPADLAALWSAARKNHALPGVDRQGIGPALAISWRLAAVGEPPTVVAVGPSAGDEWPAVYAPRGVQFMSPAPLSTMGETFSPHKTPADRRAVAVVEIDRPTVDLLPGRTFRNALLPSALRLRRISPTHVEIDADLLEERLVVLADYFAPGWQATTIARDTQIERPLEIVRTNRVLRGVFAPAGKQTIVFRYRPWSLSIGAAISGLAWCAVLASAGYAIIATRKAVGDQARSDS